MTTTETTWTPVLEVFVPGLAAPQGSKRHVGRGVMVESSKAVKPWREDVRGRCIAATGLTTVPVIETACRVSLEFVLKRPVSTPKRSTPAAIRMPDLDKLCRSTLDAMTSAGVWVDDSRVTDLVASKRLAEIGETPGAHIRVEVPA